MNFSFEATFVFCSVLIATALFASSEKAIREEVARRIVSKEEEIAKLSIMSRMFLEELMFFRGYFLADNMCLPEGAQLALLICDNDGKPLVEYLQAVKVKRDIPTVATVYLQEIFEELLDNEELKKIEFNLILDVNTGIEEEHFSCRIKLIERRLKDYITIMDAISDKLEEKSDADS